MMKFRRKGEGVVEELTRGLRLRGWGFASRVFLFLGGLSGLWFPMKLAPLTHPIKQDGFEQLGCPAVDTVIVGGLQMWSERNGNKSAHWQQIKEEVGEELLSEVKEINVMLQVWR